MALLLGEPRRREPQECRGLERRGLEWCWQAATVLGQDTGTAVGDWQQEGAEEMASSKDEEIMLPPPVPNKGSRIPNS